jgi:hypothetical protein
MADDIRHLFESRHVNDYLGIGKDQLHHWVQNKGLISPAVKESGRGGRNKFSFKNLLDLALIKELVNFGIELNVIKEIAGSGVLDLNYAGSYLGSKTTVDIWRTFKSSREKYEKNGCVLIIDQEGEDKGHIHELSDGHFGLASYVRSCFTRRFSDDIPTKNLLIININELVHDIEEKTGMKL